MNNYKPVDLAEYYRIRDIGKSNRYFWRSFSFQYMSARIRESILCFIRKELENLSCHEKVKILDIGCYEGTSIFDYISHFGKGYDIELFGIDLSLHAIGFANKKARQLEFEASRIRLTKLVSLLTFRVLAKKRRAIMDEYASVNESRKQEAMEKNI